MVTANQKTLEKYQLLPPDGGWGYIIAAALTLMIVSYFF